MNGFPSRTIVESIKNRYHEGDRIRLDADMVGERFVAGDEGTCVGVDDAGHVMMSWDKGGSLSLIVGEDQFSVIKKANN